MSDPHYAQQGLHVHTTKTKMDQVVYQKTLLVEEITVVEKPTSR